MAFYTAALAIPSVIGVIFFGLQLGLYFRKIEEDHEEFNSEAAQTALDNVINVFFIFIISIWATLFVEYWKRIQNSIANQWLVRNLQDDTMQRKEFIAAIGIDKRQNTEEKKKFSSNTCKILLGYLLTATFIFLIIFVQV